MQKNCPISSSFTIKRFQSSEERDFIKALKIYNDTIPVETKTSTNEITYFLDKKKLIIGKCISSDYTIMKK